MVTLTAVEAKKHFSEIMRRAGAGERFVVTNHGRPIAQILPPSVSTPEERQAAIDLIMEMRRGRKLGNANWKDMVNEGRP